MGTQRSLQDDEDCYEPGREEWDPSGSLQGRPQCGLYQLLRSSDGPHIVRLGLLAILGSGARPACVAAATLWPLGLTLVDPVVRSHVVASFRQTGWVLNGQGERRPPCLCR